MTDLPFQVGVRPAPGVPAHGVPAPSAMAASAAPPRFEPTSARPWEAPLPVGHPGLDRLGDPADAADDDLPRAAGRGLRETGFGIAFVVLGIVIGTLAGPAVGRLTGIDPEKWFWTVSRLTAFLGYFAFAGSVAYGLGMSTGLLDRLVGRAVEHALHRDLALAGIALTAAHVLLLLGDKWIGFTLATLFVPGESPYRPEATALGQVAAWAALAFTGTYYIRGLLGHRLWRGLHSLSVVVVVLATAHGLLAGSDSGNDLVWWTYVATSAVLLFLLAYRMAGASGRQGSSGHRVGRRAGAQVR